MAPKRGSSYWGLGYQEDLSSTLGLNPNKYIYSRLVLEIKAGQNDTPKNNSSHHVSSPNVLDSFPSHNCPQVHVPKREPKAQDSKPLALVTRW